MKSTIKKARIFGISYFPSTYSTLSTFPKNPVFSRLPGGPSVFFFLNLCYNPFALKKIETGEYMGELTLYKDSDDGNTIISNCFIDHYLADANDAQIKVYLFLLRTLGSGQATSISAIADKFNHTEKDVRRALSYWEQKGLLSLDHDNKGNLIGIRLRSPQIQTQPVSVSQDTGEFTPFVTLMPAMPHSGISTTEAVAVVSPSVNKESSSTEEMVPSFEKPDYTLDDIKAFQASERTAELLFIAEQYLKKTLSANDIRSILFLTDTLHFSNDLIDYLLQYCVQRGKKDFRYIEKVAINWAEEGIKTPLDASTYASRYDRNVYTIMNALGKGNNPTSTEVDFIKRWYHEWGFTIEVILEACERTVLATDKHRFEYADKILSSWKKDGVHHKADIEKIDSAYRRTKKTSDKAVYSNMFTQFEQRDYDFDALEKKLLSKK